MNITSRRLRTPVRMTIKSRSPSTTLTQALHRCGLGRDDTYKNGPPLRGKGLPLRARSPCWRRRVVSAFSCPFKSEECNGSCHTPLLHLHPRGGTRKLYLRSE